MTSKAKSQTRLMLVDEVKETVQLSSVWKLQARSDATCFLPRKTQIEVNAFAETRIHDSGHLEQLDMSDTYHCTVQQLLAAVGDMPLGDLAEFQDAQGEDGISNQKKKKKKKDKQRIANDENCDGLCDRLVREQQSRVETYHRTIQQFVALYGHTLESSRDFSFDQHPIALEALQQAAEQGALSLETIQQIQALRLQQSELELELQCHNIERAHLKTAGGPQESAFMAARTTTTTTTTTATAETNDHRGAEPTLAANQGAVKNATSVAASKAPQKLFTKNTPKASSPPAGKASASPATNTSATKKETMTPLGSLFAHLLDWRTFTNWPTDAKAALYSLLPYVEDTQRQEKVEDLRFRVAFTEARGVDLLYGILLCNTYDKARDQSVARLLMKILLCLKHVYPEIQDEIESIAFNTTAVTAAVHCLSKDFDDETAELGLSALRELKRHSSSSCRHSDDDDDDDDESIDDWLDEDFEEDLNEEEDETRPVVKQRRRTVSQRTPEAIRKAIDVSLISDIIETIATAGTKDEVILSKRYHYLQLVLALPFAYISGDLAEQLLFLHEKGDTTTHQKAIKDLITFSVLQLNEGRDGFINAASYCYKDHGRINLEDIDILNLSRSLIWLHKQRKLSLWWGSALVVARCLQDNSRTRDRKDLATCFLSLVGDPALEENSDSPLFVLGELLANEMSNASRSLHSILMKLGLLEVLGKCLKDAIDCYTVQNCVYCVEHLQCSASRLLETDVVGYIADSIECKRTGCDGECEKIAGRTLLQLLLMSGISEVELMVRRNYTDPFILGIANRSEECLKKFFVMPPSLITKVFTTYPASARDQFLADVAALTKHKNNKIASIASSMYPTLVQFRNADTKSWLSKCLKSKLAFDTQEYKLKTKNALVKSSGSKAAGGSKRPAKATSVQGVPNDTIHLMASGDYDGALLLCASCVDGSKACKADAYAWMVNGIAHVMRALPSSDHPSCPHTMKKAATMLNLAKTRANGGGQWLSVIHTFLAIGYAFLSSMSQSSKEWKAAADSRATANYTLGVIHYPPIVTTACDILLSHMHTLFEEADVQEVTLIYEHVGHISLVLGVYSTGYASYSRWISLEPTNEIAKEGLAKALSLNTKLVGQRGNRNKMASRREDRSWVPGECLQHVPLSLDGDPLALQVEDGQDELEVDNDSNKEPVSSHPQGSLASEELPGGEGVSKDQAELEEKRLRELLLKMKTAQEELKRKNDEVEKLVNEVQSKVEAKARQKEEKKRQQEDATAVLTVVTPVPKNKHALEGNKKVDPKPKVEEQRRKEEEQREQQKKEEERRQQEKDRIQHEEEEKRKKEEERRKREETEKIRREEEKKAKEEEEKRKKEEEKRLKREMDKRLKQEASQRRKKQEERKQKEEELRQRQENERRQKLEEERRRREEEEDRRKREEEDRRKREEEKKRKEDIEKRKKEEEHKRKVEERRKEKEEKLQEKLKREAEERKRKEEEEEQRRKEEEERKRKEEEERKRKEEEEERQRQEQELKRRKEEEEKRRRLLAEWPTCAESCQIKAEGTNGGEADKKKKKRRKEVVADGTLQQSANTSVTANVGVTANASITANASVTANATVTTDASVTTNTSIPANANVTASKRPPEGNPSPPPQKKVAPAITELPHQSPPTSSIQLVSCPEACPPQAKEPALPPPEMSAPPSWSTCTESPFAALSSASSSCWTWASSSSSSSSFGTGLDQSLVQGLLVPLAPAYSSSSVACCPVEAVRPGPCLLLAAEDTLDTKAKKQLDRKRAKQEQQLKRRGSQEDLMALDLPLPASPTVPSPMKEGAERAWSNVRPAALVDIFKRVPSENTSDDASALDALLSSCTASKGGTLGPAAQQTQSNWPKLSTNLFNPDIFREGSSTWSAAAEEDLDPEASAQATILRNLLAMVNPPPSGPSFSASSSSSSSSTFASATGVSGLPLKTGAPSWSSSKANEFKMNGMSSANRSGTMSHPSTFSSCSNAQGKEAWLPPGVIDFGTSNRPLGCINGTASNSSSSSSSWIKAPPSVPLDATSGLLNCSMQRSSQAKTNQKSSTTSSGRASSTRSRSSSGGGSISSTCSNGPCSNGACSACKAAAMMGSSLPHLPGCTAPSVMPNPMPGPSAVCNANLPGSIPGEPMDPIGCPESPVPPSWSSSEAMALNPATGWYPMPFGSTSMQHFAPDHGHPMPYPPDASKGLMYRMPLDGTVDTPFTPAYYPPDGCLDDMHALPPPKLPPPHPGYYPPVYHDMKAHPYPGLYHMPHGGPFPLHPHLHLPVPGAHPAVPMMFDAMR